MKKLFFIISMLTLISCSKESKEEKMLRDYIAKEVEKANLDLDPKDLKIEVISIKKIGNVRAKDSLKLFKSRLISTWYGKNKVLDPDTVYYKPIIYALDTIVNYYKQLVDEGIKTGNDRASKVYQKEHDGYLKIKTILTRDSMRITAFNTHADSILSTKYSTKYNIQINDKGKKQSIENILYTNATNSAFIKEEHIVK